MVNFITKFRRNNNYWMKTTILILILLISMSYKSQDSIKYVKSIDNSLTGSYSKNTTTSTTLTYVGNNSLNINKFGILSSTNYTLSHNPLISQNELSQKTNLSINGDRYFGFINHQFNYSYLRKINSDNWFGFGLGIYHDFNGLKTSVSYGVIAEHTIYSKTPNLDILRHSFRVKIVFERGILNFNTEYYFQPSILKSNTIITGTSKITMKANKYVNFTIQDVINYSSTSSVKLIHNLTLGISYTLKSTKTKKRG